VFCTLVNNECADFISEHLTVTEQNMKFKQEKKAKDVIQNSLIKELNVQA